MKTWWRKRDQAQRSLILVGMMLVTLMAGMFAACGVHSSCYAQTSQTFDLSKAILLPAPDGKMWLVVVIDAKPVAYSVSGGPVLPGPIVPGPVVPVVRTIDVIAYEEAMKLPADVRKDAATLAAVYRSTAKQFKPGGPVGTFNQAIAIQRDARDKVLDGKSTAWNPVAEATGKWLNEELAAGRLKKDDMPALAGIVGKIADGLERVPK